MKKKFIVHDWDDTITNSFQTYSGWYTEFAQNYNLNIPNIDDIKGLWGRSMPDIMSNLWPSLSLNIASTLLKEFWHTDGVGERYTPMVFDGVKDTFIRLGALGYEFGILSGGRAFAIEKAYKKHLFDDTSFHKFIISEEHCEYHKPDPKVFDYVLLEIEKYGCNLDDIVYIGDSLIDYYAAKNRGIDFIAITTGIHTKEDFINEGLEEINILNKFSDLFLKL